MIAILLAVVLFQTPAVPPRPSPAAEGEAQKGAEKAAEAPAQQPETEPAEKPPSLDANDIVHAAKIAGFTWTPEQIAQMQKSVVENVDTARKLWKLHLSNDVPPAFVFDPLLPGMRAMEPRLELVPDALPTAMRPKSLEDLAFASIPELASLVKSKQVSCVELAQLSIARLKRLDEKLLCVVGLTEERALEQAKKLDLELAAGKWRGMLHGIPWGAKDLLAARGTKTTWGSKLFADQVIDLDATVVAKLDEAGAVLVAKLSLGELAYGDMWYGGRTRNPWNLEQGSSGSSAGPAAATVAGCVAFSIGSETLGSIISPSARCGASGLRPTFGTVSRHGAMALSWTMDKLGPICRSAQDCAIVLDAIRGRDGRDASVLRDTAFAVGRAKDVKALKVGYPKGAFEKRTSKIFVDELKALGVEPVEIALPQTVSASDLMLILVCEAATAFDAVTRNGDDARMVWQDEEAWPNTFRAARLIPAVEYLRAMRLRTQLMREMDELMTRVDVIVSPTSGDRSLAITNLTGHPAISMPSGFDGRGRPFSVTFTGRLYGEQDLLAFARAWQESRDYHRRHPKLE
jgi:Asp-tRNA(Asn)/Glu-tRNA(Gln) amidotransferase A subunit family amidase